jgi:cell division septum initiation protein DivIVA
VKLHSIAREAADCRAAWAAVPDAVAGVHIHHEMVAEELSEPIEARIAYILAKKPRKEQALRLRLMRPVAAPALAEYERVTAPALAEYERVVAPAWAEYERVKAPAWAEYERVKAPAWAEYQRVVAPALAEYQRVVAPAWAEYQRVEAPALAEYQRVEAAAGGEYERVTAAAHLAICVPDCPWDGETRFGAAK